MTARFIKTNHNKDKAGLEFNNLLL
jgi:hypothetical protein